MKTSYNMMIELKYHKNVLVQGIQESWRVEMALDGARMPVSHQEPSKRKGGVHQEPSKRKGEFGVGFKG